MKRLFRMVILIFAFTTLLSISSNAWFADLPSYFVTCKDAKEYYVTKSEDYEYGQLQTIETYTYEFDEDGNVTKEEIAIEDFLDDNWDSYTRTVEYTYNNGLLIEERELYDGNCVVTYTYAYNDNDQLITKSVAGYGVIENYTYDEHGRLKSDGSAQYHYDASNRLIKKEFINDNGEVTQTVAYEYNTKGQLVKETFFHAASNSESTTHYTYDELGNCIKAADSQNTYTSNHTYKMLWTANDKHNTEVKNAASATCTTDGFTGDTVCKDCGTIVETGEKITASGHSWDDGTVTKQPSAENTGIKTYTCNVCKTTKTEEIPALGICDGGEACISKHFIDIKNDWTHEGIDFVVANGLFNGTGDTTFAPDTTMTRAMLVTVLWRNEGSPDAGAAPFTDLESDWYKTAVAWAASNGIVNGVGDGKFIPDGDVTREQIATILYRYAAYKEIDTSAREEVSSFPDQAKLSSWASDGMKWAVAEGLINGSDENGIVYLHPDKGGTRAMVATIMMRYIQNIVKG